MWRFRFMRRFGRWLLSYLINRLPFEDVMTVWYGDDDPAGPAAYSDPSTPADATQDQAHTLWDDAGNPAGSDPEVWW